MTSQSSEVLTSDVKDPSGIAWYYNEADGTSRFYVGQFNDGSVKIFDESWTTVGTIEGLSEVAGVIISPVQTVWVADRFKDKINEYDLDGNYIRNVMSDLSWVRSLSYHPAHPSYVWVMSYDYDVSGNNAKRIKIY